MHCCEVADVLCGLHWRPGRRLSRDLGIINTRRGRSWTRGKHVVADGRLRAPPASRAAGSCQGCRCFSLAGSTCRPAARRRRCRGALHGGMHPRRTCHAGVSNEMVKGGRGCGHMRGIFSLRAPCMLIEETPLQLGAGRFQTGVRRRKYKLGPTKQKTVGPTGNFFVGEFIFPPPHPSLTES